MPKFDSVRHLSPLLLCLVLLNSGCGSKTDNDPGADTTAKTDTLALTEDDQIEALMNEGMDRLRDRDKSFLYENEFAYYREKFTFDDYLKERKISAAQADTLEYIDVISVTYFGKDSALAEVEVHFKGPSGKENILMEKGVALYRHEERWIKPTLSNSLGQRQYQEIREKAKEAAQSESGGSGK